MTFKYSWNIKMGMVGALYRAGVVTWDEYAALVGLYVDIDQWS